MKLAAVILNSNNADECIEAVKRIENYSLIDSLIVVDNASSDNSRERLERFFDSLNGRQQKDGCSEDDNFRKFMLVCSDKNGGYGAGNNLGVKYAYEVLGAEYVIISNPDVSFSEECAWRLVEALSEDDEAAVASAMMDDGSKGLQQTAWMMRSWFFELLNSGPLSRRLFKKYLNYDRGYFEGKDKVYVGAVHGSLLCVDADKFVGCAGAGDEPFVVRHLHIDRSFPGTGDLFGAIVTGSLLRGNVLSAAADAAAGFVAQAIQHTPRTADTRFGVWFEPLLPRLSPVPEV